jgi:hypothetical protein
LDRWLGNLATVTGIVRVIVYGLLVLVLIVAVTFVIRELKAAGLFLRTDQKPRARSPARDSRADDSALLGALDSAPLADKPAILLGLLVEGLSLRGRLRAERHLTHKELTVHAILQEGIQRQQFSRVATLAERLLYGPRPVSLDGVEHIVDDGRALLSQIASVRSVGD